MTGDPAFLLSFPGGSSFNGVFHFALGQESKVQVQPETVGNITVAHTVIVSGTSMTISINVSGY